MNLAAGTDVVVDILFLQKRAEDQAQGGPLWDDLAEAVPAEDGEEALSINRYFIDHPEMVLGLHDRTSSAYGPIYTCSPKPALDLAGELDTAIWMLPQNIHRPVEAARDSAPKRPALRIGAAAEGATIKEGSYVIIDDELMQIIDGARRRKSRSAAAKGEKVSPPNTPASSAR
jgi:hypothetical protein